jgi:hypothetical protein
LEVLAGGVVVMQIGVGDEDQGYQPIAAHTGVQKIIKRG